MTTYCYKRGNNYYYRRRVPDYVSDLDGRSEILLSMRTSDEKEGVRKAAIYNDFVEEYWRKLLNDGEIDKDQEFKLAVKKARAFGFAYKSVIEISQSPLHEIVDRLRSVEDNIEDTETVSSLCGGADKPDIVLNDCLDIYWPLCADKFIDKSEHQIRKWKNPRGMAFRYFIESLGEGKRVVDLDRSDILSFRDALNTRILNKEIIGDSANRIMRHARDVLIVIGVELQLDADFKKLFEDLKFTELNRSRPSFEASYVQNTLLNSNSLSGLNDEARMLLYAMADTGARDCEIIGLRHEDIFLNEEIPFIWIRPYDSYSLKTETSERKIPLVGASLFSFRYLSTGFKHYKSADSASSTINKFMRENNLKPTKRHSLYSLRHTFKDRLRDIGAPAEVTDELMGHKKPGQPYGRGYLFEDRHRWLRKIAYDASQLTV